VAVFGANGAGKTTLLRILATLLRPHAGRAAVLGARCRARAGRSRGRVGLLGHEPMLYRDLTVRENLRFHARLHGVRRRGSRARRRGRARGRADEPVHTLSRGMAQRAAICRASLHAPELLLLDEPLANLDPGGALAVAPLIGREAGPARVLISHDVGAGARGGRLGARAARRPAGVLRPGRRGRGQGRAGAVRVRRVVGALVRKDLRLELRTASRCRPC
jgi:heme exporter protein A